MVTAEPVSLTLADPWPSRVRGGIPFIDLPDLATGVEGVASGDVVALRIELRADRAGYFDPEAEKVWSFPSSPDEVFDERFFHRRVHQAVELRGRLGFAARGFRLSIDQWRRGWSARILGGCLLPACCRLSLSPALDRHAPLLSKVIASELHPNGVISKIRPMGEHVTGKLPFRVEFGTEPPTEVTVREAGVRYEVHLTGGLNTGLFVDMREVRRSLRTWLPGKNVLNTFCYTGSFSVVAAPKMPRVS